MPNRPVWTPAFGAYRAPARRMPTLPHLPAYVTVTGLRLQRTTSDPLPAFQYYCGEVRSQEHGLDCVRSAAVWFQADRGWLAEHAIVHSTVSTAAQYETRASVRLCRAHATARAAAQALTRKLHAFRTGR